MPLLDIKNLNVDFSSTGGTLRAVDGVTLQVEEGEVLGIVGESGSGKSVSMMAMMGLVPFPGRVSADALTFEGRDLLALSERERRKIVGKDIAMIFQEPTTSLNPSFTIGYQLTETLRMHEGMDQKSAKRRAIDLLAQVGIPSPESRLKSYPHQMSGGMNQRVMIAMAIACNPKLLIADEPTTALDVTIQAQILDLLLSLQRDRKMALILITHNMGVVADTAERVAVMYAGQIVEERDTQSLFRDPQHPYTAALHGGAAGSERRRAARDHSRRGAGALRPAARLPVQPALHVRNPAHRGSPTRVARLARWPHPLSLSAGRHDARCTHRGRSHRRSAKGCVMTALVAARGLERIYEIGGGVFRSGLELRAVNGVSFDGRGRAHAGGGRRIRLRKIDAGAHGDHDRCADRRHAHDRRARCGRSGACARFAL